LGSDCPFFIRNQPSFATGRGNNLIPAEPILSGYHLVVVYPGIHINTPEAYSAVISGKPGKPLFESIKLPVVEWKHTIRNDFEERIMGNHPEIGRLKEALYEYGSLYSSLSGSGSAVYGIFEKPVRLEGIPSGYFIWKGSL
jgi:4-diphosphocytidyl-2-C-methyl-D-erythritol kinase